jgi:hypothetical protein
MTHGYAMTRGYLRSLVLAVVLSVVSGAAGKADSLDPDGVYAAFKAQAPLSVFGSTVENVDGTGHILTVPSLGVWAPGYKVPNLSFQFRRKDGTIDPKWGVTFQIDQKGVSAIITLDSKPYMGRAPSLLSYSPATRVFYGSAGGIPVIFGFRSDGAGPG